MPDWGTGDAGQRFDSLGENLATSTGTTVTTGTANVKSAAWVQIEASTSFDAHGIFVQLVDAAAGGDFLVDIAIGAAAAEVVICANLAASSGTGSVTRGANYFIPISIPAGTRISAKSQSSLAAASTIRVLIAMWASGIAVPGPYSRLVTYGANTADSGGVQIDPGATAHTKQVTDPGTSGGGYFTIGTTTSDHQSLIIAFPGMVGTATRASATWLVDVVIGAGRTVLIPNLILQCSTTDDMILPTVLGPFPCSIPSGTIVGIRCQSSLITAATRIFDCIMYGVT